MKAQWGHPHRCSMCTGQAVSPHSPVHPTCFFFSDQPLTTTLSPAELLFLAPFRPPPTTSSTHVQVRRLQAAGSYMGQLSTPSFTHFVCSHPQVHYHPSLLTATNAVVAPYRSPSLHGTYKVHAHLCGLWPWNQHASCFRCVIVGAFLPPPFFFLADALKIVQPLPLFLNSHQRPAHFACSMCPLLHHRHHCPTPSGQGHNSE